PFFLSLSLSVLQAPFPSASFYPPLSLLLSPPSLILSFILSLFLPSISHFSLSVSLSLYPALTSPLYDGGHCPWLLVGAEVTFLNGHSVCFVQTAFHIATGMS